MPKQVEFDYRLLQVSATDPNASRAKLSEIVNAYLQAGWTLERSETVHYEANTAFVAFHFVKYEEPEEVAKKK
jgi:hypothetical protein